MLHKKLKILLAVTLGVAFHLDRAMADQDMSIFQIHVLGGMFSSVYDRPADVANSLPDTSSISTGGGSSTTQTTTNNGFTTEESFSLFTGIDLGFEFFISNKASWNIRGTFVEDMQRSRLLYMYAGIGRRFYLFSNGFYRSSIQDNRTINIVPRWRYYIGADVGIARVVNGNYGSVFEIASAVVEAGGHGGMIYQISQKIGVEAQVALSIGLGFSTVSLTSTTTRFLVGGVFNI